MPPTSVYNLRSSRSTSSQGTPAKKSPPKKSSNNSPLKKSTTDSPTQNRTPTKRSPTKETGSTVQSPIKKIRKVSEVLEDIPQLPVELLEIFSNANIMTINDLGEKSESELLTLIQPLLNRAKEKGALKKEMFTAWIRCLVARSKDANSKLQWRNWVDAKVCPMRRPQSASLDRLPAPSRSDLVKQRQALKKIKGPMNRTITFNDLKEAKARLAVLPMGKALKDKVKPEALKNAREKLKKVA